MIVIINAQDFEIIMFIDTVGIYDDILNWFTDSLDSWHSEKILAKHSDLKDLHSIGV